jgi:zinc protease
MKKRVVVSVMLLLLPCISIARPQGGANESRKEAAGLPTVDEVLDRYVKALGGRAAIEKIKSSVAKGTMEIPADGVTGTVEFWRKAPSMFLSVISIGDSVVARTGFNGNLGWSESIRDGLNPLEGERLAQLMREADFYRSIRLKQLYPKMVLTGLLKEGDSESYVIEATPEKGRPVTFHFDKVNALLVQTDMVVVSPEGESPVRDYFAEYREVDGINTPFLTREVTPLVTVIFKLTEIKNNVPIDESKFVKPKGND